MNENLHKIIEEAKARVRAVCGPLLAETTPATWEAFRKEVDAVLARMRAAPYSISLLPPEPGDDPSEIRVALFIPPPEIELNVGFWKGPPRHRPADKPYELPKEEENPVPKVRKCPKGHETRVREVGCGSYMCGICGRRWHE